MKNSAFGHGSKASSIGETPPSAPAAASAGMFLDDAELARLTGFKIKSKQIEWLRAEGLPFRVCGTGHPVVTRSSVEGRGEPAVIGDTWTPGLTSY